MKSRHIIITGFSMGFSGTCGLFSLPSTFADGIFDCLRISLIPVFFGMFVGLGGRVVGLGPRGVIFGDDIGECLGDCIVTVATWAGFIVGFGGKGGMGFGLVIAGFELTG